MTLKISWLHGAEKLARKWLHKGENSHTTLPNRDARPRQPAGSFRRSGGFRKA
jgi:hypothetical protein